MRYKTCIPTQELKFGFGDKNSFFYQHYLEVLHLNAYVNM